MDKRANEIYIFICNNPNKSEREIADGVGLKKTPYSRQILLWLLANNYVARMWDEDRKPHAYVYYCQNTVPMNLQ